MYNIYIKIKEEFKVGNKCYFCKKRKAKYATLVYPATGIEKEVELCSVCYKKYKKLKERALINTYYIMINLIQNKV